MDGAADAVALGGVRRYLVEGAEFQLREEDVRRFPQCVLSRQLDSIADFAGGFSADRIELPGRSAKFFNLLVEFFASHASSGHQTTTPCSAYRCVILSPPEGAGPEVAYDEQNTEVSFVPAKGGTPAAASCSFTTVGENSHALPAFQAEFQPLTVCSEVLVTINGGGLAAGFPRLQVEGLSACGQWEALEQQCVMYREDAASQCRSACIYLQGAVPVRHFAAPEEWRDGGEREALYWRESDFYGIFELEMSMASLILDKLLKVYLTGSSPRVFKHWPSRDRHQLWATLWLSLRFVLDRPYSSKEVDWLVARHLLEPQAALATAVRAELLRRGFLRESQGGSFCISRDGIQWVLDGDKLFRAHKFEAATVAARPWWSLPLATQHLLLAGGPLGGPPGPPVVDRRHGGGEGEQAEPSGMQARCLVEGREFAFSAEDVQRLGQSELARLLERGESGGFTELPGHSADFFGLLLACLQALRKQEAPAAYAGYRCVLLEPLQGESAESGGEGTAVDFLPVSSEVPAPERRCMELKEGEHSFLAFESTFLGSVVCSEVTVARVAGADAHGEAAAERLPPFRVDVLTEGGEWRTALCQPMPAQDEICNQGRGIARCFLPRAVPVQNLEVPGVWLDEERQSAVRAGLELCQLDELEMGIGRLVLERWLEASLSGTPPLLRQWPTKDRQQSWVTTWLALHFVPDRLYRETEVDWMITTHHVGVRVPDCPMIRKELERRGLMERRPGGGGCRLSCTGVRFALRASGVSPSAAGTPAL